jgi:hypothetical protein
VKVSGAVVLTPYGQTIACVVVRARAYPNSAYIAPCCRPVVAACNRSGTAGSLLTVYTSLLVYNFVSTQLAKPRISLSHTSTVPPSPLIGLSTTLDFFPRTASSRRGWISLLLSRLATEALVDLKVSCVSGSPS